MFVNKRIRSLSTRFKVVIRHEGLPALMRLESAQDRGIVAAAAVSTCTRAHTHTHASSRTHKQNNDIRLRR